MPEYKLSYESQLVCSSLADTTPYHPLISVTGCLPPLLPLGKPRPKRRLEIKSTPRTRPPRPRKRSSRSRRLSSLEYRRLPTKRHSRTPANTTKSEKEPK